jgi:hypothetical protein
MFPHGDIATTPSHIKLRVVVNRATNVALRAPAATTSQADNTSKPTPYRYGSISVPMDYFVLGFQEETLR